MVLKWEEKDELILSFMVLTKKGHTYLNKPAAFSCIV